MLVAALGFLIFSGVTGRSELLDLARSHILCIPLSVREFRWLSRPELDFNLSKRGVLCNAYFT